MLLSSIFIKYFHHFPIEYHSDKDFKILYHEHLDYCRIDFKEFNVLVCDNEKIFKSKVLDRCPAFIRFNFLTRDNTYYLKAIEPKNCLSHGDLYADFMVSTLRREYIASNVSFLSFIHLERIVICKFNRLLNMGIPQKIILPKISDNFYHQKQDSEITKSIYNSNYFNETNKNMEHVYLQREGDKIEIKRYFDRFKGFTDEELVNAYNSQKAIYGVHQQVLYLIAMDFVFKERFGKSPISNEENIIFGLSGKIIYLKNLKTFEPANEN